MDISTEIAAIQAASQGSELRQPLVGALNKLNSGSLPAVTASDVGKILKVGANGWEVGEKSGYIPIPTDTMQITGNGTYDVTNYASVVVNVSGGIIPIMYLINPDELDVYNGITYKDYGLPASIGLKVYQSDSSRYFNIATHIFNAQSVSCLHRPKTQLGGLTFLSKISQGKYSKIYIRLCVENADSSSRSYLGISETGGTNNDGWGASGLKTVYFTDSRMTTAEINAQSGVNINSSSNITLSEQLVEIDISDISTDFFITLTSWWCEIFIREIYLTPISQ